MKFLTKSQIKRLAANGLANAELIAKDGHTIAFAPVVKLFQPDGAATWLLTETDPQEPDIAFGLCDLGFGCPEVGSVRLSELAAVRGQLGLPVALDRHFKPKGTLSYYAEQAYKAGRIIA